MLKYLKQKSVWQWLLDNWGEGIRDDSDSDDEGDQEDEAGGEDLLHVLQPDALALLLHAISTDNCLLT